MEYEVKRLGKKDYIYDTDLPLLAQKVAQEHKIDISNINIEYALVEPNISNTINGRCRLISNEYSLMTKTNFLITFSNDVWIRLNKDQQELLMCHELLHIAKIVDPETNQFLRFGLNKHNVQDFSEIIEEYGLDWINFQRDTRDIVNEIAMFKIAMTAQAKENKLKEQEQKKQERKSNAIDKELDKTLEPTTINRQYKNEVN